MSCLLIVDDDITGATQFADSLRRALGGHDNIVCLEGVSAYRVWRRTGHADLILVELMRHQSNGFSIAAAIARQSKTPVVLLSDRRQMSDLHWASARGIPRVLSRHRGLAVLAHDIKVLLGREVSPPVEDKAVLAAPVGIDELCASPSAALLTCLYEDLRQWNPDHGSERWIVSKRQLNSLNWLKNLLCFVRQAALRDAIKGLVNLEHASAEASVFAHQRVLFLLMPEPAWVLQKLASEVAEGIFNDLPSVQGVHESSLLTASPQFLPCRDLLNAISFLPKAGAAVGAAGPALNIRDFIIQTQCLLAWQPDSNADELPAGLAGMMYVLGRLPVRPTLAEACLMLSNLGAPQPCRLLLNASLAERYFCTGTDVPDKLAGTQPSSPWLVDNLAAIGNKLDCQEPFHQRLSHVMVSVYKLRARLDMQVEQCESTRSAWRQWQMIARCLYEYCSLEVLRSDAWSEFDLKNLRVHVHDLQQCAEQSTLPPDRVFLSLAAAEICSARRFQGSDRYEHQTLAAGLHRLPTPDTIVSGLVDDVRQSGSLMSEVRYELHLLSEIAQQLGVERVESLSRLMQDVYQLLSKQPDLLRRKDLKLTLNRAHRVLCRVLDQAAAWQPLTERGLELSVRRTINALFELFPEQQSWRQGQEPERTERASALTVTQNANLAQCVSINRRLRLLLRHRRNLEEYRSLMLELLREQHTLIATYLPYQPSD